MMLVLVIFLQQELAKASDEVARKYYDETPQDKRSGSRITAMMRATAKSKHQSFKGQFSKYTTIANPKFGDQFLEGVNVSYHHLCQFLLKHNWIIINLLSPSYRLQNIGTTMRSLRCYLRSCNSLQRRLWLLNARSDG
jgi:hypothetical protein